MEDNVESRVYDLINQVYNKRPPDTAVADTVRRNIEARAAEFDCRTDGEISEKLHMARSTYAYRRNHPRSWTLEQLILASMALKCTLNWLLTDHSGEIKEDGA